MSDNSDNVDLLAWQRRPMGKATAWTRAVTSLQSNKPLVSFRATNQSSRWTLSHPETKEALVFSHAAVVAWTSDLSTGNYVKPGIQPAASIPVNKIQRVPSFKCDVVLGLDTEDDKSIWKLGAIVEKHLQADQNFNTGKVKRVRRPYQDPAGEHKSVFTVSSQIFRKKSPWTDGFPLRYNVHPWIEYAVQHDGEQHVPNPFRMAYFELQGDQVVPLDKTDKPTLRSGDVIWMSFMYAVVAGPDQWGPDYRIIDVVRVARSTKPDEGSFIQDDVEAQRKQLKPGRLSLGDITNSLAPDVSNAASDDDSEDEHIDAVATSSAVIVESTQGDGSDIEDDLSDLSDGEIKPGRDAKGSAKEGDENEGASSDASNNHNKKRPGDSGTDEHETRSGKRRQVEESDDEEVSVIPTPPNSPKPTLRLRKLRYANTSASGSGLRDAAPTAIDRTEEGATDRGSDTPAAKPGRVTRRKRGL